MQTTLKEVMPNCLQEGETCVCKNIVGWQGKNEERGPHIPVPFVLYNINSYKYIWILTLSKMLITIPFTGLSIYC